jgi:hypothetical protein
MCKRTSEREHIIFRKYPLYIKRVLSEDYVLFFGYFFAHLIGFTSLTHQLILGSSCGWLSGGPEDLPPRILPTDATVCAGGQTIRNHLLPRPNSPEELSLKT